jgi:hypothetical protein
MNRVLLTLYKVVEALSDGRVVDASHASLDLVGSDAFLYT